MRSRRFFPLYSSILAAFVLASFLSVKFHVLGLEESVQKDELPGIAPESAGQTTEVVVKGEETSKLPSQKPPLQIDMDENETILETIPTDESLLLTKPPALMVWKQTHPPVLDNPRIIQPWRTGMAMEPIVQFDVWDRIAGLTRPGIGSKTQPILWNLTIADEDGRVFQRFEGSGDPPKQLLWSGKNDRNEWIKAGQSYSTVLMFMDSTGSPYTGVGEPLEFSGVVHQEPDGLHISLDSRVLFGDQKDQAEATSNMARNLLRSAADFIKRYYYPYPITLEIFSESEDMAKAQAQNLRQYFLTELLVSESNILTATHTTPFSQRRIEIVIGNR